MVCRNGTYPRDVISPTTLCEVDHLSFDHIVLDMIDNSWLEITGPKKFQIHGKEGRNGKMKRSKCLKPLGSTHMSLLLWERWYGIAKHRNGKLMQMFHDNIVITLYKAIQTSYLCWQQSLLSAFLRFWWRNLILNLVEASFKAQRVTSANHAVDDICI